MSINAPSSSLQTSTPATRGLGIHRLSVAYISGGERKVAVTEVSFRVDSGGSLCFVGSSGAGKSSILGALLGLLPSSAAVGGSIELPDGPSHSGIDSEQLQQYRRTSVGTIFQDPVGSLAPVPVLHQLASAYRIRHGLSRKDAQGQARLALTRVGLPDAPGIHRAIPAELSGGMCQRVGIALALSAPALRLILADEPTSNLDTVMAAQILDLLLEVQARHNATLVFITHDIRLHVKFDKIAVLSAGQIVEEQAAAKFAASPTSEEGRRLVAASLRLSSGRNPPLANHPQSGSG